MIFNILSTSSICSEYEDAALKTQSSLAYLDFGQNVILSSALSTAMVLSSYGVMSGALTIGDLVTLYIKHLFFFVSSTVTFLISEIVRMKNKIFIFTFFCETAVLPTFFSL
jgi:ABC transporter ATM